MLVVGSVSHASFMTIQRNNICGRHCYKRYWVVRLSQWKSDTGTMLISEQRSLKARSISSKCYSYFVFAYIVKSWRKKKTHVRLPSV